MVDFLRNSFLLGLSEFFWWYYCMLSAKFFGTFYSSRGRQHSSSKNLVKKRNVKYSMSSSVKNELSTVIVGLFSETTKARTKGLKTYKKELHLKTSWEGPKLALPVRLNICKRGIMKILGSFGQKLYWNFWLNHLNFWEFCILVRNIFVSFMFSFAGRPKA